MSASKSNLVHPGLPQRVGGINLSHQESHQFRERLQKMQEEHDIFQKFNSISNKRKRQTFELKNDNFNPIDLVKIIINALRKKQKTM